MSYRCRSSPCRAQCTRDVRDDRALAEQICRACVESLDVNGAAISLLTASNLRETLWASDDTADLLEDLQFTLGEGPCIDAAVTRRPILVPDINDTTETSRRPIYAAAVVKQTKMGVFTLPLQWGTLSLGVLDLYRRAPGALGHAQLQDGVCAADTATLMLLGLRTESGDGQGAGPVVGQPGGDSPGHRHGRGPARQQRNQCLRPVAGLRFR